MACSAPMLVARCASAHRRSDRARPAARRAPSVGEMAVCRLDDYLVGKHLLLEFVEGLIAEGIVELAGLGGIGAEYRKQFVLAAGDPDAEVAIVGADQHRLPWPDAQRRRPTRRFDDQFSIADRAGNPSTSRPVASAAISSEPDAPPTACAPAVREALSGLPVRQPLFAANAHSRPRSSASANSVSGTTLARAVGMAGDCRMARWARPRGQRRGEMNHHRTAAGRFSKMVTAFGSPPKAAMLRWTHCRAAR